MIAKTKKNDEDELKKNVGKSLANAVLVFIPYGYIHSLIHKNLVRLSQGNRAFTCISGEQENKCQILRGTWEQWPNFEGNREHIISFECWGNN